MDSGAHDCAASGERQSAEAASNNNGPATKRRESSGAIGSSKRVAVAEDEGTADAPASIVSLMAGGMDRGEAASAARALAALLDAARDTADTGSSLICDLVAAGHCVCLFDAGALERLVAASRTHPASGAVLRALGCLVSALHKAGSPLTSVMVASVADCFSSALGTHAALAAGLLTTLGELAAEMRSPLSAASASAVTEALRSGMAVPEVCRAGCVALEALLELRANRPLLIAVNALPAVVAALNAHRARCEVALPACRALALLLGERVDAAVLEGSGASATLVAVLNYYAGDSAVERAALAALKALSVSTAAAASELAEGGVIAAVVAILKRDDAPPALLRAALAFSAALSACEQAAVEDEFLAAGITAVVPALLHDTSDRQAAVDGVRTLSNVSEACSDSKLEMFRDDATVRALRLAMDRFPADEDVHFHGCKIMDYATFDAGSNSRLLGVGVGAAAINSVERHPKSHRVCFLSCAILWNLAELADIRPALIMAGAAAVLTAVLLEPAFEGAGTGSVDNPKHAAFRVSGGLRVLCEGLSAENDALFSKLLAGRVPEALLTIARSTQECGTACDCAAAVDTLAGNLECRDKFMALGADSALASVLRKFGADRPRIASAVCAALKQLLVSTEKPELRVVLHSRAVGAAMIDVLNGRAAAHNAALTTDAIAVLRCVALKGPPHDAAPLHFGWAYGAVEAVSAALLRHGAPDREALNTASGELLCYAAAVPHFRAELLASNAVRALSRALARRVSSADPVVLALACIALSLPNAPAAAAGPLADGTLFAGLCNCSTLWLPAAETASYALLALGHIAAMAPPCSRMDGDLDAVANLAVAAGNAHADGEDGKKACFSAKFALCMLQRRISCIGLAAGSAALTGAASAASLHSETGSADDAHLIAELSWDAHRGGDKTDLSSSLAALFASSQLADHQDAAIDLAVRRGDIEATELCLTRGTPSLRASAPTVLRLACAQGHDRLVEHLLVHWCVDPALADSSALWCAAANGRLAVVEQLLEYPEVDPAAGDGAPIWAAARNGHVAVLERLLADSRADPSVCANAAIRLACAGGHLAIIQRLLLDPRVDPDACAHAALESAAAKGHVGVLAELLADPRVDAAEYVRMQHAEASLTDLPLSSQYMLLRQPMVVHRLVLPRDGVEGVTHSYTLADVRAWCATAWRRRRHAVLAWATPGPDDD